MGISTRMVDKKGDKRMGAKHQPTEGKNKKKTRL